MPLDLVTVYGIAFLVAMVAIAVGLTWVALQARPPGSADRTDTEPAD